MEFEVDFDYHQEHPITDDVFFDTIKVLDYQSLTYNEFFQTYLYSNVPCLIRNVTNHWEATCKWVKNNNANLDYLQEKYGSIEVTVYDCSERYFNSQKTQEMTLNNYITNYWKNLEEREKKLLYLKDWHLKLQCKGDSFYEVPIYFASDWLNEYHISCLEDDYRFVYMGPKNTWTPFHADVFTSFSWSANICGKKKWIFFSPGEENKLRDNLGNLPYDITNLCGAIKCFTVIQNPGEAIFVPSGWHHQVWNLEDTISINHNWVNACNIKTMWKSLNLNLKNVEQEINHCRDMDNFGEHCQVMLCTLFGTNHELFFKFLKYIAQERVKMIENRKNRTFFHGHQIGFNHIKFDLESLKEVLEEFLIIAKDYEVSYGEDVRAVLETIKETLLEI